MALLWNDVGLKRLPRVSRGPVVERYRLVMSPKGVGIAEGVSGLIHDGINAYVSATKK